MLSTGIRPSVWSLIPFVSTPLGLYHVTVGSIFAVKKSCQIAYYFFAARKNSEANERNIARDREISKIAAKEGLHRAVETIVLGILEIVPFIGNLAIAFSKWRWIPALEKKAGDKVRGEVEKQREQLEGDFEQRVDEEVCRQLGRIQKELSVTPEEEGAQECETEVEFALLQEDSGPSKQELLDHIEKQRQVYQRLKSLWEKAKQDLNAVRGQNSGLQATIRFQEGRIIELRKKIKEEKDEPGVFKKLSDKISLKKDPLDKAVSELGKL